nr:hypothetical protein [Tanacetum cinerariifolium]
SVSAVTSVSTASTKVLVSTLPNADNLSDAVIYSFFASESKSPQLDNDDLKQIDADDLEEMDLKWRGHFARECRSPKDIRNKDTQRRNVPTETSSSYALVSQCDCVSSYDWSFQADEEPTNSALMAFTSSSSSSSDNEVAPCLESVEARLVVFQQNENVFEEDIKLLKLDVMLRDKALVELRHKFDKAEQERDDSESDVSMPTSPVHDRYKSGEGYHVVPPPYTGTFMPPKPDLIFHDAPTANETVPTVLNVEPSTTKPNKDLSQSNRPSAPIIEDLVSDSEDEYKGEPMPTQKAPSFVQTSNHVKTPRYVVPTSVLTKSRLVPLTSARHITIVVPQTKVPHQRPAKHVVNTTHSLIRRPINLRPSPKNSNFHPKVTTVKANQIQVGYGLGPQKTPTFLFDVHGNLQDALKDKGVIDSGCSRHMTGNISYLSDFEEINGGYVAFGGNPKGGKITDTECIVLSSDFKLPDENHMLLRVPRENNMYNVDLKNIVPSGYLTCLFAKVIDNF